MPKLLSRSRISLAVSAALSVTTVLGVGIRDASAQDKVERVEVTGSNIRRAQSETASPMQIISRDDIEKSGKTSVGDYLQTLAIDGAGSVPPSFGNGFSTGGQAISLRGMGASSTLVLVNGRRTAPYGLADDGQKIYSDLSSIPMEVVDRIEILLDGASAVYGSDAIAGVVNIILRNSFNGTVANMSTGKSRYNDGAKTKVAVTHGWGDLAKDGMNMFFNVDWSSTAMIMNSSRAGRDWVGQSDTRNWGYDITGNVGGVGPAGYILGGTTASSAPNGLVRNPATGTYSSLPGCARYSSIDQTGAGGGCLWNPSQFRTMMPEEEVANAFGRATWQLNKDLQAYMSMQYSQKTSAFQQNPGGATSTWGFPGGVVASGGGLPAGVVLAATHPDNPFGVGNVRVRYSTWDLGPRITNTDNSFYNVTMGLKGRMGEWDYDTGVVLSNTALTETRKGFTRYSVIKAALGDPTSPYFPYRIGVNSSLNSQALREALSPTISSNANSSMELIDFKASRELMQLQGGPMSLALGAEYRREATKLTPTTFTDIGDITGLGYSAYDGKRNITAFYGEVLAPLHKMLELSGALRYDNYSTSSSSTTPKVGIKFTPVKQLALRATYAEGFRAPNAAEGGVGGLAAFTTARDPVRCPGGTPAPGANATDCGQSIAIITTGNPNLSPEKSKSYSVGAVWDALQSTSIGVDTWQIKRSDEINQSTAASALAGGGTVVRSDNLLGGVPGTGTLLAVSAPYINSASTTVKGTDVDFRHRWDWGQYGKTIFEVKWSHLASWLRTEKDGTTLQFAGTHDNCDVTNCIGMPKDKVNAALTWEKGAYRVAGLLNWRSSFKNFAYSDYDNCAAVFADGSPAPSGCKIPEFWTFDLSMRWKPQRDLEIYGSIQNLFDKVAPLDPTTYGAVNYNPLDISGAIGRYYNVGLRYQFR